MRILRPSLVAALATAATLFVASLPAIAQTVAVNFTQNAIGAEDYASDPYGTVEPGANLGYEFSVSAPITVTSLGFFYDPTFYEPGYPSNNGYADANGFTQGHPVGIYDLSGDLLGSTSVTQANPTYTQIGDFGYTSLFGGLNLNPGDYVISGLTGPIDPYLYDVMDYTDPNNPGDGLITAPGIGYIQGYLALSTSTSTLGNDVPTPDNSYPGSYFGPNFQFTPNGPPIVPESSSLALILPTLLILAAAMVVRRRRQQKAKVE